MFPFTSKKRSISICILLTFITLITILNINSSTSTYSISTVKIQLQSTENSTHKSSPLLPRILCLILTSPKNFLTRAQAVNDTWGPRCDSYFFITEYPGENATIAEFNITEQLPIAPIENLIPGYDHLTHKTRLAFLFAYENYLNDFDWFVKADDDTYLIVDNLKAFLRKQNASEPVTFGYNFKVMVWKGFHSGGASYVLSRESLRRFKQAHDDPNSRCRRDGGNEDVEIAKCLRTKGVFPGTARDDKNRELFHPLPFTHHFSGAFPEWLVVFSENPPEPGLNCCGDQTISFHYVYSEEQYLIDFLLYKVRTTRKIR